MKLKCGKSRCKEHSRFEQLQSPLILRLTSAKYEIGQQRLAISLGFLSKPSQQALFILYRCIA